MGRTARETPSDLIPTDAPDLPFDGRQAVAAIDAQAVGYLEVSALYGDARPYDRDRVVELAKVHARNSSESMLELGKCLILIREGEGYGAWEEVCERQVGIEVRVARRLIQATTKYCSPKLSHHRSALTDLGRTKLYELMVLDDDDLAALAEGGSVVGLSLDDVERMSSRELRKALRDARADNAAKDKVLADKAQVIDRQATEIAKRSQGSMLVQVAVADPDEQGRQIRDELHARAAHVEVAIRGNLALAIQAALEHAEATGGSVRDLIAGHLGQIATAVDELRGLYTIPQAPEGRARGLEMVERWAREDAMSPQEQAQARRDKADQYVQDLRAGGKTDEVIQRMFPAIWDESSFAGVIDVHPDHLDS